MLCIVYFIVPSIILNKTITHLIFWNQSYYSEGYTDWKFIYVKTFKPKNFKQILGKELGTFLYRGLKCYEYSKDTTDGNRVYRIVRYDTVNKKIIEVRSSYYFD